MLPEIPISYFYKPKKWVGVGCFFLFGLVTYMIIETAQTNDRGLNLILFRHLLKLSLSPYEATIFYWVLATLSGLMSVLGLFNAYICFTSKAKVVLTNEGILMPYSIFNPQKTLFIPYKEILSLKLYTINKHRSLQIIYHKGKKDLSEGLLPQKSMLDEIIYILNHKCN